MAIRKLCTLRRGALGRHIWKSAQVLAISPTTYGSGGCFLSYPATINSDWAIC